MIKNRRKNLRNIVTDGNFLGWNSDKITSRWFHRFQYASIFAIAALLIVACYGLWLILVGFAVQDVEYTAEHISSALRDNEMREFIRSDNVEQPLYIPREKLSKLDKRMRQFLTSFNIAKLKIYDLETRIVYSTDPKIIGELNTDNTDLARALTGSVVSEYKSKDNVWDLKGEQRYNVKIVETYVPIRTPEGKIVGCFEIYKDITNPLVMAKGTLIRAGAVFLVTVPVVFAMLMFVIHRAICAANSSAAELMATNKMLQQEITKRKKTEETLEALNKELKVMVEKLTKTNRELADFAHITAHDLKEPLRAIGTLVGIILEDCGDKLVGQSKKYFDMLIGKAKRMSELINGILRYSEIGRAVNEKQRVDINEIVEESIAEVAPPENIHITVENDLPTVMRNKTHMRQVFQNLLSNAVKYMDKPNGQIKIGCVDEYGFWKFSVSDNGRGIEEKHFEKIFTIFQTMNRDDEVDSTGIGLSLVRKIAETYNGKAWVESEPGRGSTFFFTLPKQEAGVKNEKLNAGIVG